MKLRFSKMHGSGNDFVVIDAVRQQVELTPKQIRWLADRHFGVGCDQVLLVAPSQDARADFRYRIFNADGSEAQQCGNGARCFAYFLRDQGLCDKARVCVETLAGLIELEIQPDGQVSVNMGVPLLAPVQIPFQAAAQALYYPLEVDGQTLQIGAVSMGNPHALLWVDDLDSTPVARLGALIERHPRFPQATNVGFIQKLDAGHIRLRTWERGVGETLACGTNVCAAVVFCRLSSSLSEQVRVSVAGGDITIVWPGPGQPVMMTGPAVTVYQGELTIMPDE